MKTSNEILLAVAIVGVIVAGGLTKLSLAAKQQAPVAITHKQPAKVAEASDGDGETNDDVKDQKASAKLQSLAKVTPEQAKLAAEKAQSGTAKSVKLENENGSVVYGVVIGQQDVKVDAGNGRVLYAEALNTKDEKSEASHAHSSIQIPEAPGGDGDGETNDDAH
jgi:uncharacterized membrane protein YkoI